ncbi:NADPH-dependent methylglyoxal reductase GRE2 [Purpureocillium lavendulum]|uniref:NADPH-dependent methylglyoxal reductase GRE2 n=1 Tax=Purpureocillium lavendulum TaxID=1247861 RepID=A0AB34G834_9HYPO|nr:NADPH-dependent methylglyoxal reductase GRE2 [Purpureocillium lavendulum]
MVHVLLTGGNGFLASHILDHLVSGSREHTVTFTVRTKEKGDQVLARYDDSIRRRLSVFIVPAFTTSGAFDECLQSKAFDAILHVASPFYYSATDIQGELLDPSIIGTTSLLEAASHHPSIKTVVLTSSFAAILDSYKSAEIPEHTYTAEDWNPLSKEDAFKSTLNGYRVGKILAEKAAWDFMDARAPTFSLVTMCPTLCYGPVIQPLSSLESINTSNQRVYNFISGAFKSQIPDTGASFYLWIDVRDAAYAHVKAMERQLSSAQNRRYLLTEGHFTNKDICAIVARRFPEYEDALPDWKGSDGGFPAGGVYNFSNRAATEELGLSYRGLEESIVDTVRSLKSLEERVGKVLRN